MMKRGKAHNLIGDKITDAGAHQFLKSKAITGLITILGVRSRLREMMNLVPFVGARDKQ